MRQTTKMRWKQIAVGDVLIKRSASRAWHYHYYYYTVISINSTTDMVKAYEFPRFNDTHTARHRVNRLVA